MIFISDLSPKDLILLLKKFCTKNTIVAYQNIFWQICEYRSALQVSWDSILRMESNEKESIFGMNRKTFRNRLMVNISNIDLKWSFLKRNWKKNKNIKISDGYELNKANWETNPESIRHTIKKYVRASMNGFSLSSAKNSVITIPTP